MPKLTLIDARDMYLKDHPRRLGTTFEGITTNTNRIVDLAIAFFGEATGLSDINRQGAREFVDSLLETKKPATVKRQITPLKAVINHAIREFGLSNANPFNDLAIADDAVAARDKRHPFDTIELEGVWKRLNGHASSDLQRIWRVLLGTGCRLGEVSGLEMEAIHLGENIPYIHIRANAIRGVKTRASNRKVPLVGDALEAMREAVRSSKGEEYLFPRYAKPRGADGASQILMKHVRIVVKDKEKTVHSLRHNAKDALIRAGTPDTLQEVLFGRASGGVGNLYGSDNARLKVIAEELVKAHLSASVAD